MFELEEEVSFGIREEDCKSIISLLMMTMMVVKKNVNLLTREREREIK